MDMLTFDIVGDWDQIFQGLDLTAYEEVGHSQPSWQVHGVTHYDAAIAVQGAADTITAAADMAVDALLAFVESLELDWVEVKA